MTKLPFSAKKIEFKAHNVESLIKKCIFGSDLMFAIFGFLGFEIVILNLKVVFYHNMRRYLNPGI